MDNTFSYPSSSPSYEPVNKPSIPWRLVAIIGGTAVLVVLVILGARWFVLHKTAAGERVVTVNKITKELEASLASCEKEKNPENCRANLVEAAAMSAASVDLCGKLGGAALATCVVKVARANFDADGCKLISDKEKQTNCADTIYRALASEEMDISWCEKISTEALRNRCVQAMTEAIATTKGCAGTGVAQTICDSLKALEAAAASEDPAQCLALADPGDQVNCLEAVGSGDRDHDDLSASLEERLGSSDTDTDSDDDGLSDFDEYNKYGTDPANPDTDGDGYLDGAEVQNGYNPLGSGRL